MTQPNAASPRPRKVYSFSQQNKWQAETRTLLDVAFYPFAAYNGRWVVINGETKSATHFQRHKHIDVVLQLTTSDHVNCLAQMKQGAGMLAIDEKLDRMRRDTIFAETMSVLHQRKPGWMQRGVSKADVILWAYASLPPKYPLGLKVHMLWLEPLIDWFWPRVRNFGEKEVYNEEKVPNSRPYKWVTVGRSVPVAVIPEEIFLLKNHFVPAQLDMFQDLIKLGK